MSIIPATPEPGAEGLQVQDLTDQLNDTLSQNIKQTHKQKGPWCSSVVEDLTSMRRVLDSNPST